LGGRLQLRGGDTGQGLDLVGEGSAGVNQAMEGIQGLLSTELDSANLDDLIILRAEARGFQIEGNIGLIRGSTQLHLP
jgi:hypothetical protein